MRCCVPFCENTLDNVSTSQKTGITFHRFPSDISLRAAWLRVLGTQEHHLPDPAVVCSQHFTHDDFYETASCVKQIRPNAIPSTVQMCMICLDTDSKLSLMSKHKLEEAYEQLTGLSLCRGGNLKQTLCVLCAQRLINFSRFRDLCLRAHSLMTDLLAQDELISIQHKELMNCTTKHLKFNLTQTTLAADHCDLYIDHTDEEEQTAAEESVVGDVATIVLKNENSFCADLMESHKDDNLIDNSNNDCVSNDNYSNISIKLEPYSLDEDIKESLNNQNQIQSNAGASCTTVPVLVNETENYIKIESVTFGCTLCSEEFMRENEYYKHMSEHLKVADGDAACDVSQMCGPRAAVSHSGDSLDKYKVQATEEAAATRKSEQILETDIGELYNQSSSGTKIYTDINRFTNSVVQLYDILKKPKKTVLDENPRVKTHTGAKPYSCEICNYKTADKGNFVRHTKTHTGEKPFCCEICNFKCAHKHNLLNHIKTHTGEKPFSCEICNYRCAQKDDLKRHARIHTGEKPFSCEICNYKCARKHNLLAHMKMHTGEKPFSCEICSYKFAHKHNLLNHMKTHTGEKPYSCEVCNYKCARRSNLLKHKKRIHFRLLGL
ncbi:zinc finger protein 350 [Bicyclus anynana]|uniref:Zinc finger protein 350 n=1 Tax=Bicyclus anynana TaxID=110368 RepID=A0ABM3M423_BICAN|nr:zinc finger protein 350 [Bicyclus anynana]